MLRPGSRHANVVVMWQLLRLPVQGASLQAYACLGGRGLWVEARWSWEDPGACYRATSHSHRVVAFQQEEDKSTFPLGTQLIWRVYFPWQQEPANQTAGMLELLVVYLHMGMVQTRTCRVAVVWWGQAECM